MSYNVRLAYSNKTASYMTEEDILREQRVQKLHADIDAGAERKLHERADALAEEIRQALVDLFGVDVTMTLKFQGLGTRNVNDVAVGHKYMIMYEYPDEMFDRDDSLKVQKTVHKILSFFNRKKSPNPIKVYYKPGDITSKYLWFTLEWVA